MMKVKNVWTLIIFGLLLLNPILDQCAPTTLWQRLAYFPTFDVFSSARYTQKMVTHHESVPLMFIGQSAMAAAISLKTVNAQLHNRRLPIKAKALFTLAPDTDSAFAVISQVLAIKKVRYLVVDIALFRDFLPGEDISDVFYVDQPALFKSIPHMSVNSAMGHELRYLSGGLNRLLQRFHESRRTRDLFLKLEEEQGGLIKPDSIIPLESTDVDGSIFLMPEKLEGHLTPFQTYYIDEFVRLCRARDVLPIFIALPRRQITHRAASTHIALYWIRKHGGALQMIDASAFAQYVSPRRLDDLFSDDLHLNREGRDAFNKFWLPHLLDFIEKQEKDALPSNH